MKIHYIDFWSTGEQMPCKELVWPIRFENGHPCYHHHMDEV